MRLLLLDFEATDKEPKTARPLEYCFRGWDTVTDQQSVSKGYLWDEGYGEIPEEATAINRITKEIARQGEHPREMLKRFVLSIPHFDCVVAHNGNEYDRVLLEAEAARWGVELPPMVWIDTRTDLPYPERQRCRVLSHIALDHGIPVDPSILHGAEADVDLLHKILLLYIADIENVARIAQAPFLVIRAMVGYATKELAKKEAFRWNPEKQIWVKKIRDFQLGDEQEKAAKAGFKIKVE